jgi:hypothetical protein
MQPRLVPMCRYTSTMCYVTNSYIGKSVHLLLGQTMHNAVLITMCMFARLANSYKQDCRNFKDLWKQIIHSQSVSYMYWTNMNRLHDKYSIFNEINSKRLAFEVPWEFLHPNASTTRKINKGTTFSRIEFSIGNYVLHTFTTRTWGIHLQHQRTVADNQFSSLCSFHGTHHSYNLTGVYTT